MSKKSKDREGIILLDAWLEELNNPKIKYKRSFTELCHQAAYKEVSAAKLRDLLRDCHRSRINKRGEVEKLE